MQVIQSNPHERPFNPTTLAFHHKIIKWVFLSFVFVFCPLILAAQIVGYFDQQTGAPHALAGQNHLFLHYHDPNFTIQIELLNVTI